MYRALSVFGAPLEDVAESDFVDPDLVFQIGVAPNRIDIRMGIAGVEFPDAWSRRVEGHYGRCSIHVIS